MGVDRGLGGVLFLLDIVFVTRERGEPGLDAQNGMKLLGWAGLLGISLPNISRMMRYFRDPAILAFGCYLAICLISTVYSAVPVVTGTAALGMIAYLAFACLLVDATPEPTLYRTLFWTLATYCLANLLSALVLPDVAFFHVDVVRQPDVVRLQGISGQPNQLGRAASLFVMLAMIVAWRGYVRTIWWVPLILLGIVLTIWSGSRTSIFGVFLALLLQMPRRYLIVVSGLVALVIGGIIATGQIDNLLALVGREGSADEALSMSGRADLWDYTWRQILERPLIGYGFNSFESLAGTYWVGQANAALVATHNNYLSVLFSTGIMGLSAFLAGFGVLLYRWLRRPSFARDFFALNAMIESFSESDTLSLIAPMSTLIFLIVVVVDIRRAKSSAGIASGCLLGRRRLGH